VADVEGSVEGRSVAHQMGVTFILSDEAVREFPTGFANQMIGMTAGETRTCRLAYPADYPEAELAGQEGEFNITIHAVKEQHLPPINDELARTFGDFESLENLKARLRENLQARAEARAQTELQEAAVTELIQRSVIEFPPIMVEQELDRMIEEQREKLGQRQLTLEQWLRSQHKTMEDLRNEWQPHARERLTRGLALGELVDQEAIELAPGEAEAAGMTESQFLALKAVGRLLEIATSS
jgi:trigger factor